MSGIDINTMLSDLTDHLGILPNQTEWDIPKKLRLLNRSFWEILSKFPFKEAEKTTTVSTIAGTGAYTIPTDLEAMQHLFYDDPISLQRKPVRLTSEETYNTNYSTQQYLQGAPEQYYRLNNTINVWPIPDQVYTLTISYLASLQDLAAGGGVSLPREWGELILFGGVYRGFLVQRDFDSAANIKNHQTGLINSMIPTEVKEEKDTRYAGLRVEAPRTPLWK